MQLEQKKDVAKDAWKQYATKPVENKITEEDIEAMEKAGYFDWN